MNSKYVDTTAIIQVIGCVFNNLSLLSFDEKYVITDEDFCNDFHKTVFGAIYKIYELGAKEVSLETISDFFSTRPKAEAIYKQNKGEEWLLEVSKKSMESAFDYYYNRMKKMTLLREFDNHGIDVTDIYDPDNILDTKKKQLQEEKLDNTSINAIAQFIMNKVEEIKMKYVDNEFDDISQAGTNIFKLIEDRKKNPDVGIPMYGPIINTITRGARLGKFYLRSAPTNVGKSRTMVADACYLGCNMIYDENFGWIHNGNTESVLYITTEQTLEEIQTMMLAFLSNVDESKIDGPMPYAEGEEERVLKAAEILQNSSIYIDVLPNFSLQDIENHIKRAIRDKDVKYVVLDYIHTSIKILEEITKRSGGVKLREDNILFMIATRLKDIAVQYDVFILSATQLNANYQDAEIPDQNLLRGAKSIGDKIDVGMILLNVTQEDLVTLEPIIKSKGYEYPNLKLSIYKNRGNKYKNIYLWCKADMSTCRLKPMFCTDFYHIFQEIGDTTIKVEEESIF